MPQYTELPALWNGVCYTNHCPVGIRPYTAVIGRCCDLFFVLCYHRHRSRFERDWDLVFDKSTHRQSIHRMKRSGSLLFCLPGPLLLSNVSVSSKCSYELFIAHEISIEWYLSLRRLSSGCGPGKSTNLCRFQVLTYYIPVSLPYTPFSAPLVHRAFEVKILPVRLQYKSGP